ncbi:spore germination protein GerM [Sedimentibacter acidaminivorans]|uniref:Spore germination protein GerM n=1 Tax=Sedimentibacter acidaminivorans TaxID=913099 RepID=A0ABS4GGP5_9FIRM|nr:GerMN domain-containing protein [Sedimentibacter acidaminivorans]MBP1926550.1 spore germination protein GerM [Sedimentibacter acidaminivorans]
MRVLLNSILIILIGFLSSTYSLKLSPIDYKGSIEIETPKDTSTLNLNIENNNKILLNPESIVIKHISQEVEIIKNYNNNIFTASIYQDDKLMRDNINDLELVSITPSDTEFTITKDNPMITTMDISQKNLDLDDGTYKIIFSSNLINNLDNSSISIQVTYDTGGSYVSALNSALPNTKGLTLYFTTENRDILIPVTRFVVEDKSLTRMAIEQLQNGPTNINMKTVVGDVSNCTYNNGNILIDLPSSYLQYNNSSTEGLLSYQAFIKSIFAVDRYWPIYNISFTVDRKEIENYFYGINNLKNLPNEENNYLIYLAYKINDRYYLFDSKVDMKKSGITDNDMLEIKAQKLFDVYSNTDLSYARSPVPKNIKLQNTKIEGSTLILDFNDEFLNSYKGKNDLRSMMVESLIYTFTTIPTIDSLKITVNSKPLTNFIKDKDLSGILIPPEFINPETVY